jgi:amidase
MTDIAFAPATRLASLIRRRKIGALELLDHYLARLETYNPAVNAIVVTDIERARKRARAADRALKSNEPWGPFHGVPMTIKESFNIAGLPTTWGIPAHKTAIAETDAVAVTRWRNAGAVIFGKTNVPIFLADGQSFNAIYGVTRNPWDLARTPGGSSGGSAAALAAGLTGIETGSDIASSIRNPAHNCGVYGHKPTYGLCPVRGHALGDVVSAADISVIGPLARSAADLAPALGVLAGPDEIEAAGMSYQLPPPRKRRLRDFRVGVILNDPASEVEEEVQRVLAALVDFLIGQKAKVSDTARPALDMAQVARSFALLLAAATSYRQPDATFAEALSAAGRLDARDDSPPARVLRGATLRHRDWLALNEARTRMRWAWHDYFKDYDLLLCPAYPLAAHAHMHDVPTDRRTYRINGKELSHSHVLFWAGLSGMAYLPATAAPAGFTKSGLPVGVQIVGPHFGDRTTIEFARLLEREYQRFVPPPGFG